jgi:hypothetical protein
VPLYYCAVATWTALRVDGRISPADGAASGAAGVVDFDELSVEIGTICGSDPPFAAALSPEATSVDALFNALEGSA